MVSTSSGLIENEQLNVSSMNELSKLLSKKYCDIISEHHNSERLSVEDILELVVDYYKSIIDYMPGNVYWLSSNGVAVGCNKNVLKMLGLKFSHEFKGLTFEEMGKVGKWSAKAIQSFKQDTIEVIKSGNAKLNVEEPPIPSYDGKDVYFLTSRVPLFGNHGNVIAVVGISVDITERKKIEQELLVAKEKAEASSRAKTEFLQNMKHDFRTPFSGILSLADILYQNEEELEKKTQLKHIVNSAQSLLEQLNEIADFITIEGKKMAIEEKQFDLRKILLDLKHMLLPAIQGKGLKFVVEIEQQVPQYILGDSLRTQRILMNLLTNAIKFTNAGHVLLRASVGKVENNNVVIKYTIKDTGIGIPKEEQEFIFERFTKLTPSYKGVYQGKGLGLKIVKQFLAELNGEVYLKSSPNQGTTFIVLIPYKIPLLNCAEDNLFIDFAKYTSIQE